MSLVELRVELPAYGHSFLIHVPQTSTILDVKQEICNSCIGGPRVDGQRIIWRGRYLVDHERVEELWKSHDEPRIVHLAVHPSAWSSSPPQIPPPAQPQIQPPVTPRPLQQDVVSSQLPQMLNTTPLLAHTPLPHPLAFVLLKHRKALSALTHGATAQESSLITSELLRSIAVQTVETHGWSWPPILDEEFPAATDGGLKYDSVTINGQNFLSLNRSSEAPTPLQTHCLKVLSYTFTLLAIPPSNNNTTRVIPSSQNVPIPPNVNLLLQQLGLPQLRVAHNQNQNPNPNQIIPALREMPLRPLLAPLLMLLFRTLLLLYFVAPTRKPIFGILILAWMLYEIWRPIRNGLIRGWNRAAADNQQRQNPLAQPPPQNPAAAAEAPRPGPAPQNAPGGAAGVNHIDQQAAIVLEAVANQNISAEEQILNDIPGTNTEEPSFGHKLATLFGLLVTTIHPAVWNRRRVALRQREGRIRTEANIRDLPDENEGENVENDTRTQLRTEYRNQHARRPRWVRDYMERVIAAEWVDDSD